MNPTILVTGNCQVVALANALSYLHPSASVRAFAETELADPNVESAAEDVLGSADYWVALSPGSAAEQRLQSKVNSTRTRLLVVPPFVFRGFHPDCTYAFRESGEVAEGVSPYHSAILLWAYKQGLSPAEASKLFEDDTLKRLGYEGYYEAEMAQVITSYESVGLDARRMWQSLRRQGTFMYTINHPSASVLAAMALAVSETLAIPDRHELPDARYMQEGWLSHWIWPVYPAVARRLGVEGGFLFRLGPHVFPDIESFAEASWRVYAGLDFSDVSCDRLDDPYFCSVLESVA